MDIQDVGSGVWLFFCADLGHMGQFPNTLAAFKTQHPSLRVTAIATYRMYRRDELVPRGYVVNTEEK